jgi:hypothetical protein
MKNLDTSLSQGKFCSKHKNIMVPRINDGKLIFKLLQFHN